MPQSQCQLSGCGKDNYGYNNYQDNEVSPYTKQTHSPIVYEIQSESELEAEPEPVPQSEIDPLPGNELQQDYELQLTSPPIDSNTFGPAAADLYDEYNGVSLAEVLRDKHPDKDYYYLYVGVPKNSVNDFKNTLLKAGVQSNKQY